VGRIAMIIPVVREAGLTGACSRITWPWATAANADLAAGFLTRYDYNQAVNAAQAAPVP